MKRAAGASLFFAIVIAAVHALAQSERSVIEIAGDPDGVMSRPLRELLGRVGMSLRAVDAGATADSTALARVSVDLRSADPSVIIVDPATGEVIAMKTVHASSRKVALEELALFVRFTLDSLVDQERARTRAPVEDAAIVMDAATLESDNFVPDAAPPQAAIVISAPPVVEPPHDAVAPTKPTRVGLDLGVFGSGQVFSPDIPVLGGVGADANIAFGHRFFRPAISLIGTWFARGTSERDGVIVHAGLVSLRLLPSFALYDGGVLSIDAGLGGGMDVVTIEAHSQRIGAVLQDVSAAVPVGTLAVMGRVALGSRAAFTFGLTGDADLSPRMYVVMVDGAADSIVRPLPMRVSALLGLSVRLAGEP